MDEITKPIEELDLFENLKSLRENYNDQIPSNVVQSIDGDSNYKVRKAWFQNVISNVHLLVEEGSVKSEKSKKATQDLLETFATKEFGEQKLTTAKDIDKANELIDTILENH